MINLRDFCKLKTKEYLQIDLYFILSPTFKYPYQNILRLSLFCTLTQILTIQSMCYPTFQGNRILIEVSLLRFKKLGIYEFLTLYNFLSQEHYGY